MANLSELRWLRLMEFAAATLFVFFSSGAVLELWRERAAGPSEHAGGDPVRQVIFGVFYVFFAYVLARDHNRMLEALRNNWPLIGLIVLAGVSIVWSFDPEISARRFVALSGTTLAGLYLAVRFSIRDLGLILLGALSAASILSIVATQVVPHVAIDSLRDDAWNGVFNHRNQFARVAALGILLTALALRGFGRWTSTLAVAAAVFTFGLIMTESRTGYAVAISIAILTVVLPALLRRPFSKASGAVMALVALGVALAFVISQISDLESMGSDRPASGSSAGTESEGPGIFRRIVGRNPHLTGRVPLWQELLSQSSDRLWFGYGVGGFWAGSGSPAEQIWERNESWNPSHGHNGLLDLMLETGIAGLTLFVAAFVTAAIHAWNLARRSFQWYTLIPCGILLYLVLYNLTETTLMQHSSLYWALFVAVAFGTACWSRQETEAQLAHG